MREDWRVIPGVALAGISDAARELLNNSNEKKIWLFYGEMGAGKTTLIKAVARELGVNEMMSSPTFSLVNEYAAGARRIYHMDLYRLNSEKEIVDTGIEEYFGSGEYCFVEWPERLGRLTPAETVKIRMTTPDPAHRTIEYQAV
jgi:tRNA threonylcarbamoyladenosine biosynthesis protein TsaE